MTKKQGKNILKCLCINVAIPKDLKGFCSKCNESAIVYCVDCDFKVCHFHAENIEHFEDHFLILVADSVINCLKCKRILKNLEKNDKKPKGLVNLGNTCFFNSILQSLLSIDLFVETNLFLNNLTKYTNKLKNGYIDMMNYLKLNDEIANININLPLVNSFTDLYTQISTSKSCSINPNFVLQTCAKIYPFLDFGAQQDAHEFLLLFLDALKCEQQNFFRTLVKKADGDTTVNNKNQIKNLIDYVFGGQFISKLTCTNCEKMHTLIEPFLDISLCLPTNELLHTSDKNTQSKSSRHKGKKKHNESVNEQTLTLENTVTNNNDNILVQNPKNDDKKMNVKVFSDNPKDVIADTKLSKHQIKRNKKINKKVQNQARRAARRKHQEEFSTDKPTPNEEALSESEQPDISIKALPETEVSEVIAEKVSQISLEENDSKVKENNGNTNPSPKNLTNAPPHYNNNMAKISFQNSKSGDFQTNLRTEKTVLENLLYNFTKPENVSIPVCEHCKGKNVVYTKQTFIKTAPNILILHLKRFMQKNGRSFVKNNVDVDFPEKLSVQNYCHNENDKYGEQSNLDYRLKAVVCHIGSLRSGHYYCYVKYNTNDAFYYHISDSQVKSNVLFENISAHANAYLILYEKCI